jgi:arylsulfatase
LIQQRKKEMKKLIQHTLASAIAAALLTGCNDSLGDKSSTTKAKKPNFVTIVIDDMGYSDLGVFGGEIDTPNLDQLAGDGVILSNFYAAATSSVSRSLLFSGKDNHKNGVGTMRELMKRAPRSEHAGKPGYQGVLSLDTLPFPEVLQDNNYYTMMTGKWHMGGDEENEEDYYPVSRGFSATKSLLLGGGDIDYLVNEEGKFLTEHSDTYGGRKSLYNDNGKESDFSYLTGLTHSTDNFTNSGISMLENRDKDKPFYLNMAYLAPHAPLQAPKALIDKYVPVYSVGWDKIRQQRLERLKQKGYIRSDVALPPRPGNVKAWDDLTAREKQFEARRMAIYAAEVDLLDQNVGRLIKYLKSIGEYENTVFFIYSDNGPADKAFAHVPKGMINHDKVKVNEISRAEFDNVLAELGGSKSFIVPSPGWGNVSAVPFRGFKADSFDGGTRGAAFVHYAKSAAKGRRTDCLYSVMDIAPTILEMADAPYPSTYQGKPNSPMDGISMANIFKGDFSCDKNRSIGFELNGIKAVRKGDFKISQAPNLGNHLGLYNVALDPFEQKDLSTTSPAKYREMLDTYQSYAKRVGVVEINSVYLREELADATKTTAKIRGGSAIINLAGRTVGNFKRNATYKAAAKVSIAGEIRAEAAHVGKFAKVFVTLTETTSNTKYSLTSTGFVADGGVTSYKDINEMPTMLTLAIFDDVLSTSVFKAGTSSEIVLSYQTADGTTIANTTKPIKIVATK